MFVKVENVTESSIKFVRNQYSSEFSRWLGGTGGNARYEKYRLTPEEIQAKIDEQIGDCQLLVAIYESLRVRVTGRWSPSKELLIVGVSSGDDSCEESIECKSLAYAERLMARKVGEWAKVAAANL